MNTRKTIAAVFGLAILGAMLALLATKQTLDVRLRPESTPFLCSVLDWADCRAVHRSQFALLAGVPVAWYGFLFYWWLAMVAGWFTVKREPNPVVVRLLFQVSLAVLIFSSYQLFAMAFRLKSVCIICLTIFSINLGVFWLAAMAQRNSLSGRPPTGLYASLTVQYLSFVLFLVAGYWVMRSLAPFTQQERSYRPPSGSCAMRQGKEQKSLVGASMSVTHWLRPVHRARFKASHPGDSGEFCRARRLLHQ